MTEGRDRVVAALAGDVVDRPPVSAWGHDYEAEWFPHLFVRATVDATRRFDWDWVKMQNRETSFAEDLGGIYRPDPSGRTFPVTVRMVTDVAGWQEVIERAETGELGPSLLEQVDLVSAVTAELGPGVPVIQTVFSPLSVVSYLVGRNPALAVQWLRDEPFLMGRVIDAVAGLLGTFAERSIAAGASGLFYAITGFASDDLMDEEWYRRDVLASDHRVLEQADAGWFTMLHLCMNGVHFSLADELPVHSVNWADTDPRNPSLTQARSLTRRAVVGGVDRADPIRLGRAPAVYAAARDVLRTVDPRGHMLAPGCSVSPWPKDRPENLLAFRAAAEPERLP